MHPNDKVEETAEYELVEDVAETSPILTDLATPEEDQIISIGPATGKLTFPGDFSEISKFSKAITESLRVPAIQIETIKQSLEIIKNPRLGIDSVDLKRIAEASGSVSQSYKKLAQVWKLLSAGAFTSGSHSSGKESE